MMPFYQAAAERRPQDTEQEPDDALSRLFTRADRQLLMDLCLLSADAGNERTVDALAAGLKCLRPRNIGPVVARAKARINARRPEAAVELMRAAPPGVDEEERCLGEAVLAMALEAAGRAHEAQWVAQRVAAQPEGWLARAMLDGQRGRGAAA